MPVYTFKCQLCEKEDDKYLELESYSDTQICRGCCNPSKRVFKSPQINMGFQPWYDIGKNRWINSKAQQTDIMRRENKVLDSHSDLIKESKKNKKENTKKANDASVNALHQKLHSALS